MEPADAGEVTAASSRLARLEVSDLGGRGLQTFDVHRWPVRIGRALDNDLVLSDPHVAAHHATLDSAADGSLVLRVGETRNGARIEQGRGRLSLAAGEQAVLPTGSRWQLGQTLLRARCAADLLPEELPLGRHAWVAPRWLTPVLALLALGWWLASVWLEQAPDGKWLNYVVAILGAGSAVGVWAFGWGLAAKLFTGHFVVAPHLRLVLAYLLIMAAADLLLVTVAFAWDLPWVSHLQPLVGAFLVAALLAAHLCAVVPQRARRIRAVVAGLTVLGLAVQTVVQWQQSDRLSIELYAGTLLPPAFRLVPGRPVQSLLSDLRSLEQPLRDRARKAQAEDAEL